MATSFVWSYFLRVRRLGIAVRFIIFCHGYEYKLDRKIKEISQQLKI